MRIRCEFALAASILLGSAASRAATITDVELYQGGEAVTFGAAPDGSDPYGLAGQSGLAGQIILTTSAGGIVDAWCMDLFHDVYLGAGQNLVYNGFTLAGSSNGNGGTISPQLASEIAGLVNYGNALLATSAGNVDQSAGIQMAIWSLEYTGLTFTGPSQAVADWQQDVALAPALASPMFVETLISDTGTQQLVAFGQQIPEPPAVAVVAAGLLGLLAMRRQITA